MKYTKKRIEHMIERNKSKLKELKDNQDNLSVWGYRDMGYYEGRISVLEDLLDEYNDDGDSCSIIGGYVNRYTLIPIPDESVVCLNRDDVLPADLMNAVNDFGSSAYIQRFLEKINEKLPNELGVLYPVYLDDERGE